jgi:hypothetical protein
MSIGQIDSVISDDVCVILDNNQQSLGARFPILILRMHARHVHMAQIYGSRRVSDFSKHG